jgi:hypothetical protein
LQASENVGAAIKITKHEITVCIIFAVFRTLEEDQKKKDALVDIFMKLVEKNPENINFAVVPSTLALNQSQQTPPDLLLSATSDIVPQIVQEAPPVQIPAAAETHQRSV